MALFCLSSSLKPFISCPTLALVCYNILLASAFCGSSLRTFSKVSIALWYSLRLQKHCPYLSNALTFSGSNSSPFSAYLLASLKFMSLIKHDDKLVQFLTSFGFLLTASSYYLTASPNFPSLQNSLPCSLCWFESSGLIYLSSSCLSFSHSTSLRASLTFWLLFSNKDFLYISIEPSKFPYKNSTLAFLSRILAKLTKFF